MNAYCVHSFYVIGNSYAGAALFDREYGVYMKITFQTTEVSNMNTDSRHTAQKESGVRRIGSGKGYALDLSGGAGGSKIYRENGKTAEDIMREAGGQNVALTHNYMAVMSNCMSDEDFAKLQENGYQTGSTDVETAVTIVDQIKASLLQAGVSITGYTDTLDRETLTEITGDAGLAQEMSDAFSQAGVSLTQETAQAAMQALGEASLLQPPGEKTLQYMVEGGMEPTLQNLYLAQYSSRAEGGRQGGGYYREETGYLMKKAEGTDWESLKPQIDQVIEEAGLEQTEGAEDAAEWLISRSIPLTKETLTSYLELKQITLPQQKKEWFSAMATAVSDGKAPENADLTGKSSLWQQAAEIWNRVQKLSGEAASLAAESGKPLTLKRLYEAQGQPGLETGGAAVPETARQITARRQLEEIRLQMTISANRELLKSGYAIETSDLEQLVEALKDVENRQNEILFCGKDAQENTERAALYEETVQTVGAIPQTPLAAVGRALFSGENFTLSHVRETGDSLAAVYRKANESYETFQTAPRADMGDSIKKAFRNTEVLLDELFLPATEDNKRAVRILGYNRMELTEENIGAVKEADQALRCVLRKLTPAAALKMIRDGENPMRMNLAELDDYLSERQDEEAEKEKYGRFLYKLEQKKEITEEEKQSYIGIYRLLRQVEKSDGAVIGALVSEGAELSFRNLLSAVRTFRAKRVDAVVGDDFGTVREVKSGGVSIDTQISAAFGNRADKDAAGHDTAAGEHAAGQGAPESGYYRRLAREAYENLDADKLTQIGEFIDEETDLERFTEALRETETERVLDEDYRRMQIEELRQSQRFSESGEELLARLGETITPENIRAAQEYQKDAGKAFKKIKEYADITNNDGKLRDQITRLIEHFDNREDAGAAYRSLTEAQREIAENAVYDGENVTSLDVREMGLVYKQISFAAKLADTEKYEIPVMTEDSVIALHLQIVHSDTQQGVVEASMETERYGKLRVKLSVEQEHVKGFLIGSEETGKERLDTVKEEIVQHLEEMGFTADDLGTAVGKNVRTGFSFEDAETEAERTKVSAKTQVSTRILYRVAKAVIGTIHQQAERGFHYENQL